MIAQFKENPVNYLLTYYSNQEMGNKHIFNERSCRKGNNLI